jgi:hypothetical protein
LELRSVDAIIAQLEPVLGTVHATDLVRREAAAAGLGTHLTTEEALDLLHRIEALGGPAGLAARVARSRAERALTSEAATTAYRSVPPPPGDKVTVERITQLLGASLGHARAAELVAQVMGLAGMSGVDLARDDAVRLLDIIEQTHPHAASAARFAKVTILLRSDG